MEAANVLEPERMEEGPELDRLVHERVLKLPSPENGQVLPYSTEWEHARQIRSECGPFVIEEAGGAYRAVVGVMQESGECLAAESWANTKPLALCRAALISVLASERR